MKQEPHLLTWHSCRWKIDCFSSSRSSNWVNTAREGGSEGRRSRACKPRGSRVRGPRAAELCRPFNFGVRRHETNPEAPTLMRRSHHGVALACCCVFLYQKSLLVSTARESVDFPHRCTALTCRGRICLSIFIYVMDEMDVSALVGRCSKPRAAPCLL